MKPTPDQKFRRHQIVWESLTSKYTGVLWPFVFPWGDQRQISPARLREQEKRYRHASYKQRYTLEAFNRTSCVTMESGLKP